MSFIEPFGTLWFIYLLPIFFVVIRLTRRMPWPVDLAVGAALEIAHVNTGWMVIDEFAARFVYFYTGYIFAHARLRAHRARAAQPLLGLAGLLVWGLRQRHAGASSATPTLPFVSLALGLAGAGAVVTVAALMAKSDLFRPLRYCGRNSIVIYLAFFLPMAATRTLLLKTGIITDLGTISLIVTAAGVIGALCLVLGGARNAGSRFLFERPALFWLAPPKRDAALQPAE